MGVNGTLSRTAEAQPSLAADGVVACSSSNFTPSARMLIARSSSRPALCRFSYRMLKWSSHELIKCLEVLPQVGEDETSHLFEVSRDALRLELAVFQYEADVRIAIYRDGSQQPIFYAQIISCPFVRYVAQKNGLECLEISGLFGYRIGDEDKELVPVLVRVAVNPQIQVELSTPSAA